MSNRSRDLLLSWQSRGRQHTAVVWRRRKRDAEWRRQTVLWPPGRDDSVSQPVPARGDTYRRLSDHRDTGRPAPSGSSPSPRPCNELHTATEYDKDQSHLAKGRIAAANPPNFSFVFAGWQHKTEGLAAILNCMVWLGVWPPNRCFPWETGTPSNAMWHWTHKRTCQMASKSVELFKQGVTDDRQTDRPRYREMCRNRPNRLRSKIDSA